MVRAIAADGSPWQLWPVCLSYPWSIGICRVRRRSEIVILSYTRILILQYVATSLSMNYFVLYASLLSMLSPMIAMPHDGSLPLDSKEIVIGRYSIDLVVYIIITYSMLLVNAFIYCLSYSNI
jgi:hypothetical protein